MDGIIEGELEVKYELTAETLMAIQIEKTIEDIQSGHALFVTSFARLGTQLNEVKKQKLWREWGFESFGQYIKSIEIRLKKGRSQIYNSIAVADRLLPYASETDIEKMGIGKATELAKVIKLTGSPPSETALQHAQDPKIEVDEFKAELFDEHKIQKLDERGKYLDLKGFFVTDEERQEIEFVFDLATKVDPPIPQETSEWQRRKEIIMRLIHEFRATYESEVTGEHP